MWREDDLPANRIEIEGTGVGEVNSDLIALRAAEIAVSDGRALPTDQDFAEARKELAGHRQILAPEQEAIHIEDLASGSPPEDLAVDRGHGAETPYEADDSNSTRLIEEGIEEADRDQRVQSAREQARDLLE